LFAVLQFAVCKVKPFHFNLHKTMLPGDQFS
jgi:hypothetical protein